MVTTISIGVDQGKLKDRLSSMKEAKGIFPTGRLERDAARGVAEGLMKAPYDRADAALRQVLSGTKLLHELKDGAFTTFAGTEAMRSQLVGFANAGMAFVTGSQSYATMSLRERASIGGNTAVTRVLKSGERLLLETQRLNIRFRQ